MPTKENGYPISVIHTTIGSFEVRYNLVYLDEMIQNAIINSKK